MIDRFNNNDTGSSWADAIAEIKKIVPTTSFLQKAKKGGYICPFCGSGSGPNGTGAQYYKDTNLLCCFAGCDRKTYDVIDIWGKVYNVDYKTAVSDLAQLANIPLPGSKSSPKTAQNTPARTTEAPIKKETETAEIKPKTDYSAYFKECADRLGDPAALVYLSSRGISRETAERFNLGFDPESDPANKPGAAAGTWKPHPAPRLIVPMGKYSFTGRRTDSGEDFKKTIAKDGHAGLTVPENFRNGAGAIFVTEGAFDALAIMEAAPETRAISLNSTNNADLLIKSIEADKNAFINDNSGESWPVIVCLDNDNAGRQAQHFLLSGLKALGLPCIGTNLDAIEGEDPNDILTKYGKEEMRKRVLSAIDSIKYAGVLDDFGEIDVNKIFSIDEEEPEQTAPAEDLQQDAAEGMEPEAGTSADEQQTHTPPYVVRYEEAFVQYCEREFVRISTGILPLDIALHGGLTDELYILGAETGQGKSVFSMQLAQNIAAQGIDVLYFALEMSTKELIARGISAESWRNRNKYGQPVTAGDILYFNYDYTAEDFVRVPYSSYAEATKAWFSAYGGNLIIRENTGNGITAKDIQTITEEHVKATGKKPVVFVDYLQMLAADPDDRAQSDRKTKTDIAVRILKNISVKLHIPVFTVSSIGRQGYGKRITTAAFKESGDLEFTGGVLLGLNLEAQIINYKNPEEAEKEIKAAINPGHGKPRKMILEVMKFRNGERSNDVQLDYFAEYNYMAPDGEHPYTFTETSKTPFSNTGSVSDMLNGKPVVANY